MLDFTVLDALPATHPAALLVKPVAQGPQGVLAAALATGRTMSEAVDSGGGLAQLARYEQAGDVIGVVPLGVPAHVREESAGMGALSTLAVQSVQAGSDQPSAATLVRFSPRVALEDLVAQLNADPQVAWASTVPARYAAVASTLLARPSGTNGHTAALTWNLERIHLGPVLSEANGADVRVGVLDTGVDQTHPLLQSVVTRYVHGQAGSGPVSDRDIVGHGTHVSGIVAAHLDPSLGMRGVSGSHLQVWKIFDDTPDYVARAGIYWYMVDPVLYRSALADCVGKVDVINLSIGGTQAPDPQEAALFRALVQEGVTVVAAMGNERSAGSPTSYPAAIPGVVAVGASTQSDQVATFSNAGEHISLAAPGAGILSTLPTQAGQIGYRATQQNGHVVPGTPFPRPVIQGSMDGTSMAAPHVTGAAALFLANSRSRRSPQDVKDFLMVTASRVPSMGSAKWTRDLGGGVLNLQRLVFAAQNL